MKKPIWKRWTVTLVLLAFFAAALGPFVPQTAAAEPCALMMTKASSDCADQSSKDAMPDCGSGLSCIVMVALPEFFEPVSSEFVWAPVRYWAASNALTGLSIAPDHSPPISHA